jgi:ABC-type transporter Mla MlaB component
LLAWQRAAKAAGQSLQFLNPPASLQSLLQLYDVAQLLQLHVGATTSAPAAPLS